MIFSSGRNSLLWTVCAVAFVSVLAGCRGFFVNPTLSSISITPSNPNLQVGQTMQLGATGVFSDGSSGNVSNVTWTSSDSTHVTVSSTGLIKGIANTTSGVTITATSGTATGSVTVTVGQSSTITVNCANCSGSAPNQTFSTGTSGTTISFTASQGGTDVTSSATWTSSNQAVISNPTSGQALVSSVGTATITATVSGASGTDTITVTQ